MSECYSYGIIASLLNNFSKTMKRGQPNFEIGDKAQIPNNDMPGWIQTLREGGFTDEEIDRMLIRLNKEYAKQKGADVVEEELKIVEKEFVAKSGRYLNEDEKEYFKKGIRERLGI